MKILTVDVGTGTQDIYLYNSQVDIENGFKLVVPSPTMMVHKTIKEATQDGGALLITGVTMGGGPSHWAARDHVEAGNTVYVTPEAARTFDDDLDKVEADGFTLIGEDETARLPGDVRRLEFKDFDFQLIARTFEHYGVDLGDLDAVAVAVFDHGAAPPEISDRQFRFDYLDEHIRAKNRLSAFAFQRDEVPEIMTRLLAVVETAGDVDAPLVVMDTAPAAVLGATLDPVVGERERVLVTNVGNFHTLAFRLGNGGGIEGVFEHHTGLIDRPKLEGLLSSLASGELTHEQVFGDHGHGALVYGGDPLPVDTQPGYGVAVTGPRRTLMRGSSMRPYFPAPYGDMMITGCFGLLAATADVLPERRDVILESLQGRGGSGTPPWEVV